MSAACPLFGFDIVLEVARDADAAVLEARFLEEAIERDGLAAEASPLARGRFTITRDGGQATDADRQAVVAWASSQSGITCCEVGPLVDLGPSA